MLVILIGMILYKNVYLNRESNENFFNLNELFGN